MKKIKVIGWSSAKSLDFLPLKEEEVSQDVLKAIVLDIKDNRYLFNGSDHLNKEYCVPVLSNYKKVVLSLDDFNELMKLARDDNQEKRYPVYPSGEKTIKERKDIYLKHKVSNKTFRYINNFFKESDGDLLHLNIYLFPLLMDDKYHYWIDDRILIFTDGISEKIYTRVIKIFSFDNYDDFNNKIKDIEKYDAINRFGFYQKDLEKYQDSPFVLLGLIKCQIDAYISDLDILANNSIDEFKKICKCQEKESKENEK